MEGSPGQDVAGFCRGGRRAWLVKLAAW